MIILDTNVLIDFDQLLFDERERYSSSILCRAELEFDVSSARDPDEYNFRLNRIARFDGLWRWLAFDLDCTRAYGFLAANAKASGARIRSKDALIAAQARRYGAALMTANTDDFAPFTRWISVIKPPN